MKFGSIHRRLRLFDRRVVPALIPAKESLEYPLLSELFSLDRLDKHGEALARLHPETHAAHRERWRAR